MRAAPPLLSVENLSVEFRSARRTVQAVRGLSFDVAPGETVAVVGESGSGKSVTALSIMRLVEWEGGRITAGAIRFRGERDPVDLRTLDEPSLRALRGNAISMVFQEPMTSLNPVLTIGRQLAEVLVEHRGASEREALASAKAMLESVRIPDAGRRLGQHPHELSGGMRQRIMVAMALLCRPALLIADEPTTALDVTIQAQILSLLRAMQAETGAAVLFITHDLGIVAAIADRVVVMRHGECVETGDVDRIFTAPSHPYTSELLAAVPRLGGGRRRSQAVGRPAGVEEVPTAPILAVEGLVKRFPIRRGWFRRTVEQVHAVEHVSLALGRGETLGLVGESGCGKSTTGRAIMKLVEPNAGSIRIDGEDVTRHTPAQMRPQRRKIQMIFQDPFASLNPRLPVHDLVTEPLAIHGDLSRCQRKEKAAELIRRVGLDIDHLDRYPHQFSGGQRQRLSIARALSVEPAIIVADEPVSALDVSVQRQVLDLLQELQDELGLAYLFISHDMGVIERMSDRVAVMYGGEIVETGPAGAVLHDPQHPYTRKLLAAVPVPDPRRRHGLGALDASEIPSPIRPAGYVPPRSALEEVADGHFVRRPVQAPDSSGSRGVG